MAFRTVRLQSA
jgi:hypothetical protein